MTILAIDTSTELLSVCLTHGDNYLEVNKKAGLKHASQLMPVILSLVDDMGIKKEEIDLIVCARGPGSFTGLRIGIAAAKGLSFGLDRPLKLVPTLDAMAYRVSFFPGLVLPVIDARKQRYYTCLYRKGRRESDYLDISLEDIFRVTEKKAETGEDVLFTGPDADKIDLTGQNRWVLDPVYNHSTSFSAASLGRRLFENEGPDPEEFGPLYVRKSEAEASMDGS